MRKSVSTTLRVLLSGCRRLERSKYVWYYKSNTLPLFARVNLLLDIDKNVRDLAEAKYEDTYLLITTRFPCFTLALYKGTFTPFC